MLITYFKVGSPLFICTFYFDFFFIAFTIIFFMFVHLFKTCLSLPLDRKLQECRHHTSFVHDYKAGTYT